MWSRQSWRYLLHHQIPLLRLRPRSSLRRKYWLTTLAMARLLVRGWFIVRAVLEDVLLEFFERDHQASVMVKYAKDKSRLHSHPPSEQQRSVVSDVAML